MDTNNIHVHQFKETVVPSTCRTCGYTLHTCACGYEHKTDFKPLKPHDFQTTEATPATCTEAGSMTNVCADCGEVSVREIPPLGHLYDNWVVKAYPTCREPGVQVRKCRRCSAVEERSIRPTGHKCVPDTARYENGELVEYFCANCGQTVRRTTQTVTVENQKGNGLFGKIMLLAAFTASLLKILFMVLLELQPHTSISWSSYITCAVVMLCYIPFALQTGSIRQAERYTRWMGAVMLVFAALAVYSIVLNIKWSVEFYRDGTSFYDEEDLIERVLGIYLPSIIMALYQTAFYGLLAAMFFRGGEKKTWLFVAVLIHTVIAAILSGLSCVTSVSNLLSISRYYDGYIYDILCSCAGYFASAFWMIALTALVAPVKKKVLKRTVETTLSGAYHNGEN